MDTTQTRPSAVDLYATLFDHGQAAPFAQEAEPIFSTALTALFDRAASDETLRPLVVAIQDAGWRFAFAAHDDGCRFGESVTRAGLTG